MPTENWLVTATFSSSAITSSATFYTPAACEGMRLLVAANGGTWVYSGPHWPVGATLTATTWLGQDSGSLWLPQYAGLAKYTARQRRRATRIAREADRAAARARRLLVENISDAQRAQFEAHGYFDVSVGQRTYRIHQGTHGNVRRVEGGVETVSLCAQPAGVPVCDAMLAQKLLIETDEAAFLRIANARTLVAR